MPNVQVLHDALAQLRHAMATGALGFVLLAMVGAFLIVAALGLVRVPALGVALTRLRGGVSLADAATTGASDVPDAASPECDPALIERLLAPFARRAQAFTPKTEQDWVEYSLRLLSWPDAYKTVAAYYSAKVLLAFAGFVFGVLIGLRLSPYAALPAALGCALAGYVTPKLDVRGLLKKRDEAILFEVPMVAEQIAIMFMATRSLQEALKRMLEKADPGPAFSAQRRAAPDIARLRAELGSARLQRIARLVSRPRGGYLMLEIRQVIEDALAGATFREALGAMRLRVAAVPMAQRMVDRLLIALEGQDLREGMKQIAASATEQVEQTIQERGEQNATLMIVPAMLGLVASAVVLAAPSVPYLTGVIR